MWHEVRKQERKIRCMIVDYKRRAERRKDYYEKIKADPTQFLQIHGRPCKIHLDPAVAAAGDSPANMMTWQGGADVVIDRFDVRAHLDYIPEVKHTSDEEVSIEERQINYERYRILVQNDFLGVSEDKFLHQIYLEEMYGAVSSKGGEVPIEGKKKVTGAAIGYNYDDPTNIPTPLNDSNDPDKTNDEKDEDDDDEDSDIDFDMCVDVNKVSTQQAHELNNNGQAYGMEGNDFFSFLTKDREEADNLRLAKELEEEKAMYSGRKSRRERRAYREKKLAGRKISPPSYASRKSPTYRDYRETSQSRSKSRSASPFNSGQITYITSFGGDDPPPPTPAAAKFPHKGLPLSARQADARPPRRKSRSPEYSRKTSRYRTRSRSRSPSRKHGRRYSGRRTRSRSRSRSHSYSTTRRRSRSRSRSTSRRRHKSRSPKNNSHPEQPRTNQKKRSKSRSPPKSSSSVPVDSEPSHSSAPASIKQPPPPVISRYYGRRRNESSSSELSLSDDDLKSEGSSTSASKSTQERKPGTDSGNASGRNKGAGGSGGSAIQSYPKITPQERLKKKMQALLNKQYKADKRAEREKREKVEQERIDREDEMREIAIKLRKRERMRRHEYLAEYDRYRSESPQSRSRSSSRSCSPSSRRRERRRRSRSHSRSIPSGGSDRSESRSRSPSRERDYQRKAYKLVDY